MIRNTELEVLYLPLSGLVVAWLGLLYMFFHYDFPFTQAISIFFIFMVVFTVALIPLCLQRTET